MKGSIFREGVIISVIFTLIAGCAKQALPTGGPKDVLPPKLVKSIPLNGTVNFKGASIVMTFDEFFTLDKINEKFMVSPPMTSKPLIVVRGKNLIVDFKEKTKDSTTYTLYFQDAIKDLDEGNPLNNFQFVFSTGKEIDSLSVTGNELNSFDLETVKNTLVMMYRNLADSAPLKLLPDYITQADENGAFRINNVKEGKYRIYSLQDNNSNRKYDPGDEAFAFIDSVLNVNPARNYLPIPKVTSDTVKAKPNAKEARAMRKAVTDTSATGGKTRTVVPYIEGEHKLFMFTRSKRAHYLTSSGRKTPYELVYTLSLPPDTSKFEFGIPGSGEKAFFIEKNQAKDTITVWLRDSSLYSNPLINTLIRYPYTDSTGGIIYKRDTIKMRYLPVKAPKAKTVKDTYRFSSNIQSGFLKPGQEIIFSSPTPFRKPDTSRIKLYEKQAASNILLPFNLNKDSSNSRRYLMKVKLKEGGKYLLITDQAAFGSIYGEKSDWRG